MRYRPVLIFWSLVLLTAAAVAPALADLAPPKGWHPVRRCVTITNLADFPDIVLAVRARLGQATRNQYLVEKGKCLYQGYKLNRVDLYALPAQYVQTKGLKNIDLATDPKAVASPAKFNLRGGFVEPAIPLIAEQVSWKILGFSKGRLILFKYKEILKFNDGRADQVKIWPVPKVDDLSSTIQ